MRIILIEADSNIRRSLELVMRSHGIHAYATDMIEEGSDLVRHYDHDLILIDLDGCDATSAHALQGLRGPNGRSPIVALSKDRSIETQVRILDMGADDYVAKPFDTNELIARLHALVRRSRGHSQSEIVTGGLSVNLMSRTVTMYGKPVHVTKMEYRILELLSLRRGSTLTKQMFIEHLYGDDDGPESRTVELFVCKLRKKLTLAGGAGCIETIGRRGYTLADPDAALVA